MYRPRPGKERGRSARVAEQPAGHSVSEGARWNSMRGHPTSPLGSSRWARSQASQGGPAGSQRLSMDAAAVNPSPAALAVKEKKKKEHDSRCGAGRGRSEETSFSELLANVSSRSPGLSRHRSIPESDLRSARWNILSLAETHHTPSWG